MPRPARFVLPNKLCCVIPSSHDSPGRPRTPTVPEHVQWSLPVRRRSPASPALPCVCGRPPALSGQRGHSSRRVCAMRILSFRSARSAANRDRKAPEGGRAPHPRRLHHSKGQSMTESSVAKSRKDNRPSGAAPYPSRRRRAHGTTARLRKLADSTGHRITDRVNSVCRTRLRPAGTPHGTYVGAGPLGGPAGGRAGRCVRNREVVRALVGRRRRPGPAARHRNRPGLEPAARRVPVLGDHFTMLEEHAPTTALAVLRWLAARFRGRPSPGNRLRPARRRSGRPAAGPPFRCPRRRREARKPLAPGDPLGVGCPP